MIFQNSDITMIQAANEGFEPGSRLYDQEIEWVTGDEIIPERIRARSDS